MAGDFSDDEWDISDDQLRALEHNAIISSQQPNLRNGSSGVQTNTNSATNAHSGSTLRLDTPTVQKAATATFRFPHNNLQQQAEDSFDNPALDEDGVPLVVEEQRQQAYTRPKKVDETTQREQWRLGRFAQKVGQPAYRPPARVIPRLAYQNYQQQNPQYGRSIHQNQANVPARTPVGTQFTPSSQTVNQEPTYPLDQASIHAELEKERREKESLQQKFNALTNELHTAKGETALIRSKNINDAKIAEGRLNAARRQIQEQVTKHQAELQSRDAVYDRLITDHNFVKHELDEHTRKVALLQRQVKDKSLQDKALENNLSPRKNLQNTLRDGFDDIEILQQSPARSPAKKKTPKPSTPSKKRKLVVNSEEEPALTLRFSQPQKDQEQVEKLEKEAKQEKSESPRLIRDCQTEQHLDLMRAVFAFRPTESRQTLLESLMTFSFPSDLSVSIGSLLLLESSKIKGSRLTGDLLSIFTKFLTQCAREEYYKPLAILLTAIDFIFDSDPTVVDAEMVQTMIRPLQTLATINPRRRWNLDKNKAGGDSSSLPKLDSDVSTSACLNLLFVMSSIILDEPELIRLFWRCMDTEFVLLMLTPIQMVQDLHLMLELLATSVQPDTFGNICNPEEQSRMETYIVDKICFLLWDPPRHVVNSHPKRPGRPLRTTLEKKVQSPRSIHKDARLQADPPPTRADICNLRLQALSLLFSLLKTPTMYDQKSTDPSQAAQRGVNILLSHPTAIARLVRSLYDEVSLLSTSLPTHALHAKLVNTSTAILHHLLLSPLATDAKSSFGLQRSLSGTLVGVHKFRIVMTRIAFREERPAEHAEKEGIDEESVRKATEILEEYVTPDEAVQLVEVLGRGDGENEEIEGYGRANTRNDDEMMLDEHRYDEEAEMAEADVMAGIER